MEKILAIGDWDGILLWEWDKIATSVLLLIDDASFDQNQFPKKITVKTIK